MDDSDQIDRKSVFKILFFKLGNKTQPTQCPSACSADT